MNYQPTPWKVFFKQTSFLEFRIEIAKTVKGDTLCFSSWIVTLHVLILLK